MNRPGWNPNRRNRNIGTPKQGHGQDNRLKIPDRWPDDRVFYEGLSHPVVIEKRVQDSPITFLVEPPQSGFFYPCTVEDVLYLFSLIPSKYLTYLDLFIFRQPTRKERALSPVWGRLIYFADVKLFQGTAIYLEAQKVQDTFRCNKSLAPREQEEFERLRKDGHDVKLRRRDFEITTNPDALRATHLYRTVLHELGHLEDWLTDKYYGTKTTHDKELFADRFADRLACDMRDRKAIPFERILSASEQAKNLLQASWFLPSEEGN